MFVGVALTASLTVALLVVWRSKLIVENEAYQKLTYQTSYLAAAFDEQRLQLCNYADYIETSARQLYPPGGLTADNIESYKSQLLKHLQSYARTVGPLSLWIVLSPELPTPFQNIAIYDRDNTGNYEIEPPYDLNSMDMKDPSMKWWTDCIAKGEVWTEPYYWKRWDMELISYSRSLYINGKFIGCLGSDYNFSEKRKQWSSTKVYDTGYIFLVNQDRRFIYHPEFTGQNAKEVLVPSLYLQLQESIHSHGAGCLNYQLLGETKVMAYQELKNGWVLFVSTPKSEILAGFKRIGKELVIILAVVTALSFLVSLRLSHSITAPISSLVASFNLARKGNLDTRSDIWSHDEIQELGIQFNYLMSELQHMLNQLHANERELVNAKERAERSDRLKTSFLANLSHEIRTPLNAIVGYSDLLMDKDFSDEERKDFVHIIQSNNNRLLKYIEDTLLFSQLEQNQITPRHQNYPLSWVEDDLCLAFEKYLSQFTHQLEIRIKGKNLNENKQTWIDPELTRKIIDILTDNAVKFTKTGSLELSFFENENNWGFSLADTGVGISDSFKDQIFEKFFKEESQTNVLHDGLGLGLAIAKEFTRLLKGSITVESTCGIGSVFKVTFPLYNQV